MPSHAENAGGKLLSAATLSDEIHLPTEDEAWNLLEQLVTKKVEVDTVPRLSVGDWSKIDVYIPGKKYDSAITPNMMKGWVELQQSVYRAYSLSQGGKGNGRALTEREKEDLELIVEVKSGSSDQAVDIQAILEKFATAMADKMEPNHIVIVLIVLTLT